ncbi:WAT1-related protein [Tripterygium wilfordii]|uniref:WAT1-related protein n=1 Tax=Tripterygium wilfordii TaxID=458696 RepID=A0A7J7D006_TRIWF|nr:WAT1-related protein At1g21890-like [Tripterygium wilfordii]KAF5739663.1 WAT1-related protein [Tripterygium wilfordii]
MVSEMLNKVKPYLCMISLQFGYAGMYVISLVSLKHGMNHYVLAVYRHVVATIVIVPFALLLERKIRPKLTLPIFLRVVALGFLEPVMDQNLYYVGLKYTSATFASAVVNVLPAITFIMALIFRLESVNFKKIYSVAKVIGTTITVSGAMVMTLYRGPIIDFLHGREQTHQETNSESSNHQHHLAGTLMVLGSVVAWSGFFILQSFTLKKYPAELSLTALVCVMGVVEGTAITLVMERDMSVWKIGFDSRLLAAVYSGVVCSGVAYYVQGLVNKERGPVFATSFSPLCMIITGALGAIVLSEKVHLGSIIGAIFIVIGLYTVVWGKSKEGRNSSSTAASLTNIEKNGNLELPIKNDTKSVVLVSSNVVNGDAEVLKIPA